MGRTKANAMKFWTREEYRQFIATQEDRPAERMAFQVLYWCGLRIGELLALTPADIDLDGHIMSISKTLQKVDGRYMVTTPKTEKSKREITLPAFLCDELAGYMKRLYGLKKKDRLFDFTKDKLRTDLIRGSKESGVPQIRLHDLRHSHASLLIELGVSPLVIAERLGHDSVQTTLNTYAHLYPNKQGEVAEKLNSLGF